MKKVKGLFLAALAAAAMFTSCGSDDDAKVPVISFPNNGGEAVAKNVGDSISFQVDVTPGDGKLIAEGVDVTLTLDGLALAYTGFTTTVVGDNLKVIATYKFTKAGVYVFTIDAIDKDEVVAVSQTKTVTVTDAAVALTSKGEFILGAGSNAAGSYYSLADGVYTFANAKLNAAKIAFVYNFDATTNAEIFSATLATNADIKTAATVTKFEKVTGVTFATAKDSDIAAITPTETKLTGLKEGDVIAFLTADGSKGLILVKAITTGVDGKATLSVSVK